MKKLKMIFGNKYTKTYKLSNSDDFEVSIGKRVLATEFVESGKFPVATDCSSISWYSPSLILYQILQSFL